ncbi:hypothetical protein CI238_07999, partial [Colletotrichum incanum]
SGRGIQERSTGEGDARRAERVGSAVHFNGWASFPFFARGKRAVISHPQRFCPIPATKQQQDGRCCPVSESQMGRRKVGTHGTSGCAAKTFRFLLFCAASLPQRHEIPLQRVRKPATAHVTRVVLWCCCLLLPSEAQTRVQRVRSGARTSCGLEQLQFWEGSHVKRRVRGGCEFGWAGGLGIRTSVRRPTMHTLCSPSPSRPAE